MAWRVEFDPAAARDLKRLDPQDARRVLDFLNTRLRPLDDPRQLGQALKGARLGLFWKYRVGDFRIIAHLEDQTVRILVLRIGHRRHVYR